MSQQENERLCQQRRALQKVADKLIDRRLTAPAIFFLESIKPLSFIASQALIFFDPLVQPLLTIKDYRLFAEAVESRDNLEWLIQRLEEAEERGYPEPTADRSHHDPGRH